GRTIFVLFFVIGVLCGASAPGLLDLLARLPGFSLALNYRLVFLAGLGLAGLAALGVEEILAGERRGAAGLAGGVAVVFAGVFFFLRRGFFRRPPFPSVFLPTSRPRLPALPGWSPSFARRRGPRSRGPRLADARSSRFSPPPGSVGSKCGGPTRRCRPRRFPRRSPGSRPRVEASRVSS